MDVMMMMMMMIFKRNERCKRFAVCYKPIRRP